MKKLLLLLAALAFSVTAFSANKTLHPKVNLVTIKAVKTGEDSGDEIYIDITQFKQDGAHKNVRIPEKPMYWPSEHLEKVANLALWESDLVEGESTEVIFTFIEHDMPPWNVDDLIGTVQLKLRNKNGELESAWSMPNRSTASVSVNTKFGPAERFTLTEEGHVYDVYLQLQ